MTSREAEKGSFSCKKKWILRERSWSRSSNPRFDPMKEGHMKKRLKSTVELGKNYGTRVGDLTWLCSLSDSETDMLTSLKSLIIQRAELIGCDKLSNIFDLKIIRIIAFVLMENLKIEGKEPSLIQDMVKSTASLDACNLLKCKNDVSASIEELNTNVGADIQTLLGRPPTSKQKKQKVGSRE